jgi:hypothetical protein
MDYLNDGEKAAMIDAEHEFDRKFIHELYREKIETIGHMIRPGGEIRL